MIPKYLVLQSDFGLNDGAVAAMHGVAYTVAPDITISDLTHGIPPYDIFSASYRLIQTIQYWPEGTVFVSVVDPGVGSERRSVVARLDSGHYIVTPDNGTLSHAAKYIGIEALREIDEDNNRLPYSQESHTFHGRDVYVYNAALLASDTSCFEGLEQELDPASIVTLDLVDPAIDEEGRIHGVIDTLDIRFGSLWTNIPSEFMKKQKIQVGDGVKLTITYQGIQKYQNELIFGQSFADVKVGEPLVYINSLIHVGIAINQQSFSDTYNIGTGKDWKITIEKINKR